MFNIFPSFRVSCEPLTCRHGGDDRIFNRLVLLSLGSSLGDRLVSPLDISDGVVQFGKGGYHCAESRNHRISVALLTVNGT